MTREEAVKELDQVNNELTVPYSLPQKEAKVLFNRQQQLMQFIDELDKTETSPSEVESKSKLEAELNEINREINNLPNVRGRLERLDMRRRQIHVTLGLEVGPKKNDLNFTGMDKTFESLRDPQYDESRTIFHEVANKLAKLLVVKEKNYGQSFNLTGDILRIMAPDGIKPNQYDDVLTVVRILDKLFRVMKGAPDEESPFRDIAGYAILKLVKESTQQPQSNITA